MAELLCLWYIRDAASLLRDPDGRSALSLNTSISIGQEVRGFVSELSCVKFMSLQFHVKVY